MVGWHIEHGSTDNADFGAAPTGKIGGFVPIPNGASSAEFQVGAENEGLGEGTETFKVVLEGTYVSSSGSFAEGTIKDGLAEVTISGGGSASEGAAGGAPTPATFTVTRTGGNYKEPLTVSIKGPTGTATAGQDYESLATSVTIDADKTSATFQLTPIDDGTVETPKGEAPATETVIVAIADDAKYIVKGNPATATIADDPAWFYTKWAVKEKPDAWRLADEFMGIKEFPGPGFEPINGANKYVERYFTYEEWVPLYDWAAISQSWGVDAKRTLTFAWGEEQSFSWELSAEAQGQTKSISIKVFEYQITTSKEQGFSEDFVGAAGADEKALVIPLVRRKVVFCFSDKYVYQNGTWVFESTTRREEAKGYLKLFGRAILFYNRQWLDQDAPHTESLRTTEPLSMNATDLDELLGRTPAQR